MSDELDIQLPDDDSTNSADDAIADLHGKIAAIEAEMQAVVDAAKDAQINMMMELIALRDTINELGKDNDEEIPQELDSTDDHDWAHPDSQFAVPATKSIEQSYTNDTIEAATKVDNLRLFQFDASTFAPIACADLVGAPDGSPSSTNDYVLVRKVVAGVPTLVYSPVVEMTVMTVAYTDSTNKELKLTPHTVKVLCDVAGTEASGGTLTFTLKTLVTSVAPDSATAPTKLESSNVTGFILSAVDVPDKVPIINIEGCT